MNWEKKGLLFNPAEHKLPNGCFAFAQSPQALVFDDFIRIYFSTRAKEPGTNKYLSHIAFVDFDINLERILNISSETVIELGELGCFDEHGIFPINVLRHEDKVYAYTCGWSRRISVSVETSTGFAVSHNNGLSFKKQGMGPIMSSSLHEPVLVGDAFVRKYQGRFHMWYIFGTRWIPPSNDEPPARIYKIGHAISEDGIDWVKEEGRPIITDSLNEQECQALPTVIRIGERYHMYFCYRQATDFRKNSDRGYRLGYAWSDNLVNWTRNDEQAGIDVSPGSWDADMMCYPHLFEANGNIYLLYNGNEFGKHGFGYAKLKQDNG